VRAPTEAEEAAERVLADRATRVLRGNDLGHMTTAAPRLYPHMWSWDACFIGIGLASVDVGRAITEMDTLLSAQWRTGMLPHIVFSSEDDGYFPGPAWWDCAGRSPDAPREPRTSGICQPPVHAIAVDTIMATAERGSDDDRRAAQRFLDRAWPRLLAWHRWLATARDPEGHGRVTIHHGWESGMDNSPRWDGPYSRIVVGRMPPYTRVDRQFVSEDDQRPTDQDYDRYVWLVEEMRLAAYDDARVAATVSFAVEDVFFSAVLAIACEVMADLGARHHRSPEEVAEMAEIGRLFRRGVAATVDPVTGLARDRDLRTGSWLAAPTVAGFAPLLCGLDDPVVQSSMLTLFASPDWCGHRDFVAALPPSTSPASALFDVKAYWRGPQWPVLAWLFGWAFSRHGLVEQAEGLRREGLRLLADGQFGEYYQPFSGEPLGSSHQSWTAAVALDWLGGR
jgi:hypothetical protein